MYTSIHAPIAAKAGEPVRLVFTVTDAYGTAVSVEGGSAVFRVARRAGEAALLEKTAGDGVSLAENVATVDFSTSELAGEDGQMLGDFIGQLVLTLEGVTLVAAEGVIAVSAAVGPAA